MTEEIHWLEFDTFDFPDYDTCIYLVKTKDGRVGIADFDFGHNLVYMPVSSNGLSSEDIIYFDDIELIASVPTGIA